MIAMIVMKVFIVILMIMMTKMTKKHTNVMTFQQKCTKFRDFYLVKKGLGQCSTINDYFLRIPSLIFDPARGEERRSLTDEARPSSRWKPYCKMYISQIAKYIYLKLQNIFVPNCKVYFFLQIAIYICLYLWSTQEKKEVWLTRLVRHVGESKKSPEILITAPLN